jgi:hypothetical protein
MTLVCICFLGCPIQLPDDHGNTPANATPIVVGGEAIPGSIETDGDVDYFSFQAEEGETYVIETAGSTDTYLALWNSTARFRMRYSDRGGEDSNARIVWWEVESPGTYYIEVSHYNLAAGTGMYSFSVSILEDDHGNHTWSATPVMVDGDGVDGRIDVGGDIDFFSFYAEEGFSYLIELVGGTGMSMSLRDSRDSITFDYADEGSEANLRILWLSDTSRTRYVHVHQPLSEEGEYLLSVSTTEPIVDDHGNDPQSATPLVVDGESLPSGFDYNGDDDYFSFQVEAGVTYTMETTGTSDTHLVLYDASGFFGVRDEDSGTDTNARIVWTADSSREVFLKASAWRHKLGGYAISVTSDSSSGG